MATHDSSQTKQDPLFYVCSYVWEPFYAEEKQTRTASMFYYLNIYGRFTKKRWRHFDLIWFEQEQRETEP